MPIARHFIDWSQPALPAAADWLVARAAQDRELDLGQTIVVVPGARAGRRLLELLVERADAHSLALTPPAITTEHALPELLYQPKRPFASQLTQQLAWSAALQETPAAARRHFLPHPPANGETVRWLALGDMLRRLHVELAADGLDFKNVLAGGDRIDGFAEHDRWQTLADVQQRYLNKLDDLDLWDIQTARLVAIRQREPQSDRDIVLVGMVDLNRAQRQLLDLLHDKALTSGQGEPPIGAAPAIGSGDRSQNTPTNGRGFGQVHALVFAPTSLADHFDEHGCLVPERWAEFALNIRDQQVARVDGPADQAEAVTQWLVSLGGKYRADQIVVGVPDERLAPAIARQLTQSGIASRWVEAKRLAETGPYRLLKVAAEYAQRERFADLAALVRHPDLFDWLQKHIDRKALAGYDPLTVLDEFATEHVPASLDAGRLAHEPDLAAVATIARVIGQLTSLMPTRLQPLAEWAGAFRGLLGAVYGERVVDRNQPADRYLIEALDKINAGLAELDQLPATMMPKVGLREALELAVAPLASEPIPPPAESNVVEILGWLELPLDDAPALVVTTFNEGFVPKSTVADSFLPNRLRSELGLLDNDRRYARDAYATSVLSHSRAELRLIVGHRDADGNPLVPSRLLFAADEESVVRRARHFFGDLPPSPRRRNLLADKPPRATSAMPIPKPIRPQQPADTFSVTEFRTYLACPYRYYLRHVLNLRTVADSQAELEAAAFGTLLHDVLQRFSRADDAARERASSDPELVFGYLSNFLDALAAAKFGLKHCRPAVRVQIEQARTRLRALAEWQATRTSQGWRIVHGEDTEKKLQTVFKVDAATLVKLQGRIDRIDYHAQSRTLAILDYKTGDSASKPHQTHRHGGDWIDLQLPLYRHLVQDAGLVSEGLAKIDHSGCRLELGYILLPKDVQQIGLALAEWTPGELGEADEVARHVIRQIRAGVFEPLTLPPPAFSEDFAVITQDHRLGVWHAESEGDAA